MKKIESLLKEDGKQRRVIIPKSVAVVVMDYKNTLWERYGRKDVSKHIIKGQDICLTNHNLIIILMIKGISWMITETIKLKVEIKKYKNS